MAVVKLGHALVSTSCSGDYPGDLLPSILTEAPTWRKAHTVPPSAPRSNRRPHQSLKVLAWPPVYRMPFLLLKVILF